MNDIQVSSEYLPRNMAKGRETMTVSTTAQLKGIRALPKLSPSYTSFNQNKGLS
jgi:hypothetical protein